MASPENKYSPSIFLPIHVEFCFYNFFNPVRLVISKIFHPVRLLGPIQLLRTPAIKTTGYSDRFFHMDAPTFKSARTPNNCVLSIERPFLNQFCSCWRKINIVQLHFFMIFFVYLLFQIFFKDIVSVSFNKFCSTPSILAKICR